MTTEEALRLLERAIAIYPGFAPALSALALRSLVAWYAPFVPTPPEWSETCAARVENALRGASSLAETHVAAAVLHLEWGSPREAEVALAKALRLAPTCVEALEALAELECQTGRVSSGTARAQLACELDPRAVMPAVTHARVEAFAGRLDRCIAILDRLGDRGWHPPAFLMRIRAAAWHGQRAIIREWIARGAGMSDASGRFPYGELVARVLLGEAKLDEIEPLVDGLLAAGKSPRFCIEVLRVAVEMDLVNDWRDDALRRLAVLGDSTAFVDLDWLERCPPLRALAAEPEFRRVHEATRRRAYAST